MHMNIDNSRVCAIGLKSDKARVLGFLVVMLCLLTAFHYAVGPSEMHQNFLNMGRHILHGEPTATPGNPMLGYSILMTALGPFAVFFNAILGFIAFWVAYEWLGLGSVRASAIVYLALFSYAALISSWQAHGLVLSLLLLSLAVLHRFGASGVWTGVAVGLLWGLAYNARSEVLLLFAMFMVASSVFFKLTEGRWALRHHSAALAVFAVAVVPWAIYTWSALGTPALGTTNGWAVAYYGFGLVPGNRYGIECKDEYAFERANVIGESSPWSAGSNEYFRHEYFQLAKSDPALFLQRVGWGLFTGARVGLYIPDIRETIARTPANHVRLLHVYRDLKRAAGIPQLLLSTGVDELGRLGPRPEGKGSALDIVVLVAYFSLGIVMKVAFAIVLIRTLLLIRTPNQLLATGPVTAYVGSVALCAGLVAAFILPTERLNSILFVLATILTHRASVVAMPRRLL